MKRIINVMLAVVAIMLVFCMTGCSNNFWTTKKPLNPSDEIIKEDDECPATKKLLANFIEKYFKEEAVKVQFQMWGDREQNINVQYENSQGKWMTFTVEDLDKVEPMIYRSAMYELHQIPFVDDDPVMAEKDK